MFSCTPNSTANTATVLLRCNPKWRQYPIKKYSYYYVIMSAHSRQPCAAGPAVQCCSPSTMVLTALLPAPSPPCHSWDNATKRPLTSSSRGDLHSLGKPNQNYHTRNHCYLWVRAGILLWERSGLYSRASHSGAWEKGPALPQQDQAHWKVVFHDSKSKTTKAQAASTNTYQTVLMAW